MKKESSPNTRMFKASRPRKSRPSSEMAKNIWTWKWSKRNTLRRSMTANFPNREQKNQKEETRNRKRRSTHTVGDSLCGRPGGGGGETRRADYDASSRGGPRIRPSRPPVLAGHFGRLFAAPIGDP